MNFNVEAAPSLEDRFAALTGGAAPSPQVQSDFLAAGGPDAFSTNDAQLDFPSTPTEAPALSLEERFARLKNEPPLEERFSRLTGGAAPSQQVQSDLLAAGGPGNFSIDEGELATTNFPSAPSATPSNFETMSLRKEYRGEEISARHLGSSGPDDIRTRYLYTEQARQPYAIGVDAKSGKITQADEQGVSVPLDTGDASGIFQGSQGGYIFAMSPEGSIYAGDVERENARGGLGDYADPDHQGVKEAFHHSSFFAGGDVAGAGEMAVRDGTLSMLTNISGHYHPTPQQITQTLDQLEESGAAVEQARVHLISDKERDGVTASVGEFRSTGGRLHGEEFDLTTHPGQKGFIPGLVERHSVMNELAGMGIRHGERSQENTGSKILSAIKEKKFRHEVETADNALEGVGDFFAQAEAAAAAPAATARRGYMNPVAQSAPAASPTPYLNPEPEQEAASTPTNYLNAAVGESEQVAPAPTNYLNAAVAEHETEAPAPTNYLNAAVGEQMAMASPTNYLNAAVAEHEAVAPSTNYLNAAVGNAIANQPAPVNAQQAPDPLQQMLDLMPSVPTSDDLELSLPQVPTEEPVRALPRGAAAALALENPAPISALPSSQVDDSDMLRRFEALRPAGWIGSVAS
jgi:hypothetical protein